MVVFVRSMKGDRDYMNLISRFVRFITTSIKLFLGIGLIVGGFMTLPFGIIMIIFGLPMVVDAL